MLSTNQPTQTRDARRFATEKGYRFNPTQKRVKERKESKKKREELGKKRHGDGDDDDGFNNNSTTKQQQTTPFFLFKSVSPPPSIKIPNSPALAPAHNNKQQKNIKKNPTTLAMLVSW